MKWFCIAILCHWSSSHKCIHDEIARKAAPPEIHGPSKEEIKFERRQLLEEWRNINIKFDFTNTA